MITLSVSQIAEALSVPYHGLDALVRGASTDTRTIQPDNIFVAICGDRFDGHDFIEQAELGGASALLVSRAVHSKLPSIVVPDTMKALGRLASFWKSQFSIPCIAITGSNGKTTTKNMVASIMKSACDGDESLFLASMGNLNNHIGLPLNLLHLNANHRMMVVELGMSSFGEIAYLTRMVQPTVAVITNALPCHLQGVGEGRLEDIAKAKGELLEELGPDGICVLNQDSDFFGYWKALTVGRQLYTFSCVDSEADVYAESIHLQKNKTQFDLALSEQAKATIELRIPGIIHVSNALAAAAAGKAIGLSGEAIVNGLNSFTGVYRRLQSHHLPSGVVVIDDSYNANPASVRAAIDVLVHYAEQKILVLGDMRELGEQEEKWHMEIGVYAREAGIDYLFAVGNLMRCAVEAFGDQAFHFESQERLLEALRQRLKEGTVLLVKGSLSTNMGHVVKQLIEGQK